MKFSHISWQLLGFLHRTFGLTVHCTPALAQAQSQCIGAAAFAAVISTPVPSSVLSTRAVSHCWDCVLGPPVGCWQEVVRRNTGGTAAEQHIHTRGTGRAARRHRGSTVAAQQRHSSREKATESTAARLPLSLPFPNKLVCGFVELCGLPLTAAETTAISWFSTYW